MSEDALDIENHGALADYLRRRDPPCEMVHARTLAGGVSNRTVLVQFADGQSWVIKQALAKLRTKADWFSDPARVHREALGIRWLGKLAPPGTIPEFVFEDFENHLLAMQAVPEPHENWKEMLLAERFQYEPAHFEQFGTLLGTIQRLAMDRKSQLATIFDDVSFFESLRLDPYYSYTAHQVPESRMFLETLIQETRRQRISLVHGDFSPKNILVHSGRLVLLDHEVIHWGDPAFDVGFALAHLISKARARGLQRLMLGAWRFWDAYERSNRGWLNADAEAIPRIIRHTLACMLARVSGKSLLEYLSEDQRASQRDAVITQMTRPETTVYKLIHKFVLDF